jgi:hypothetical protein
VVGDRDRQRRLGVGAGLRADDEFSVLGQDALAGDQLGVGGGGLVVLYDVADLVAKDSAGGVDVLEERAPQLSVSPICA